MAFLITTVEFSYFVDISCLPSSIFFTLSLGLFSKVQINYIIPLLKKQNVSSKALRLIDCILFHPHFSPTIRWCHAVSYFQDVPPGIIYFFCHLLPLPTPPNPVYPKTPSHLSRLSSPWSVWHQLPSRHFLDHHMYSRLSFSWLHRTLNLPI